MCVLFFQKEEHFDLLELFLNSEYDPNKTDTAAISDCERLVETVAKQKFLSTQVCILYKLQVTCNLIIFTFVYDCIIVIRGPYGRIAIYLNVFTLSK